MNAVEWAPDLTEFLGRVEEHLQLALANQRASHPAVDGEILIGAARHLCIGGGGKRIRPLMVRLFADACGAPAEPLVELAAAAELIHSASLLHDDVVDGGMFRRGRPTVNARWGNIVAVMTGDLLLTIALTRLSGLSSKLSQEAIDTVAEMTRAAITEVEARGDLSLSFQQLRAICEGKTGSLFAWCGVAPALLAGDPQASRSFSAFGRRLGVAFQIADDIRDLTGTDQGKPTYADLHSRTPSLPILLAAAQHPDLRRRINEAWSFPTVTTDRARELGTAVLCSGVLGAAVDRMNAEIEAAIDALGPYSKTQGGAELESWARRLSLEIQRLEDAPQKAVGG
jgi:octaprenyl-diphosphate synthase